MHGNVEIELNGEIVSLRCTLGAAMKINEQFGNYWEAYQRIQKLDMEAYFFVIAAALGKTIKEVREPVFATGIQELSKPLSRYINILSNGGRDSVIVSPENLEKMQAATTNFVRELPGFDDLESYRVHAMLAEIYSAIRPLFVTEGDTRTGESSPSPSTPTS